MIELAHVAGPATIAARDRSFFSRDQEVSRVSSIDEEGTVSILVDARLQQALEEAIG